MLFPVFKAIIGHYRRRPFQILLIWIGLTLGTALLVGVMAVNHHAQVSYAQGEKIFSNPLPYRIRARVSDQSVPSGLYLQLRQAGFNQCIPIDSQEVRTKSGLDLKLVGFDPISMLSYQPQANINDTSSLALMKPPYPVKISPDLMKRYDLQSGQYFELEDGRKVGPIQIDRENLAHGNQVFMDIAEFRAFTAQKQLSLIACGVMPAAKAEQLRQLLPSDLFLSRYTAMELTSLTNAFHLNLTALGMLAFMVGMFIFYQAMARSFAQRQHLVGSLRLLGVRRLKIAMCLGVELILWVIVSWLSGNVIGLMLANYLIPEVAETLNQLYDIKINLIVNWQWGWSLQSLGMVFVACIIASLWPFLRLMNTLPVRLSTYLSLSRFSGNQFGWEALFGCACIVAAVALYLRPPSQEIGFLLIGAIMLSVGLIVPFLLWRLFVETAKHCKTLNMRWFFSDCASSMSYRGMGAMAFMLAIAANIGIQTVVDSFRDTTQNWLTQRLAADIYLVSSDQQAPSMVAWLEGQDEIDEVWRRWEEEIAVDNETMQVVSAGRSEGEQHSISVKQAVDDYWHQLHQGHGVLISESLAIKHHLELGDTLLLPEPLGSDWQVLGIYYDYGNPYNQFLISEQNWLSHFKNQGDVGLGLVLKPDVDLNAFSKKLRRKFNLSQDRMFYNKVIYDNAMNVFDQTFSVTRTLSSFTLFVALLGLFFATIASEKAKRQQFALMRSLGMSAHELALQTLGQLLIMGILCILFAIPLGLVIAKLLIIYVIKNAFGWTMDLSIDTYQLALSVSFVFISLAISSVWPTYSMLRHAPTKLFQGL